MAKSGVMQVLLKLLQYQNKSIFDLSIATLLILSSCTTNKPVIANSGALNTNSNSITIQAKLDIISTLHNLSTSHQIIPSIVLSGFVVSLFQLIYVYEKSSVLVEKAVALLEIALKEIASTEGAIRSLREKQRAHIEGRGDARTAAVERGRNVEREGNGLRFAIASEILFRWWFERKQWKNALLEQAMEQIDADERVGVGLRMVEETIAKLSAK
ncbi:hypothetical protein Acr_27g0007850 [Actinidia rufa]|uniref:ARM repeat superfamily protein n=1 Tax=Actinidia rufa TaxID=165716 RepID=A0A7J0H7I9_9ERIC|nr:hypothetical protein Acr_27g0007850 [Actinidia rufa]